MDHVIQLVVRSLEKQDSSMMLIIVVYAKHYSNGLLRTVDAPENAMKSIKHFLMKVQMLTLVNVLRGINGTHLLVI